MPADLVLMYTTEKSGQVFIRTDQLDGETDWKLRRAVGYVQEQGDPDQIAGLLGEVTAKPPSKDIYDFEGVYENQTYNVTEPLGLENTMWANTVLASSGYIVGLVLHTGAETRA